MLLSGVFFTFKVSRVLSVARTGNETLVYRVSGQVFFASSDLLVNAFDVREVEAKPVVIDVSGAHFWDITSVAALDKVCQRLRKHGSSVEVTGLNAQSRAMVSKLDLGIE